MLIRFRVSNYLSFKDEVELSLINGASQKHTQHVIPAGNSGIKVLRSAVIYGANASGKSNLMKAVSFTKKFILRGLQQNEHIPYKPFKLDPACEDLPSKFEFEFFQNGKCYLYGFEITSDIVQGEWLYEIKKTTEQMLFERHTENNQTSVSLGIKLRSKKQLEFLKEFSSGTRPNQLFLTKCYDDSNVNYFNDIVTWFKRLEIIFPDSKNRKWPLQIETTNDVTPFIFNYLQAFDTGICGCSTEKINPEGTIPNGIIKHFQMDNNQKIGVFTGINGQIFIFHKEEDSSVNVQKIVFQHRVEGCNNKSLFDMSDESDGTLRIIDLLPFLYLQDTVFLVDELDRSLHPSLSYKLLELFLSNQKNSQLIATTHEDHLLNLDLLRRDEIWFVEKDPKGATNLYSLEEFAPRHDKDIQKGYLQGRFGAIPIMGNNDFANEEVQ